MSKSKSDFSETKEIQLNRFFVWSDSETEDFNAFCEKPDIPVLLKVVESLMDSFKNYGKGKRVIRCGHPTSKQLEELNQKSQLTLRQWVKTD